ncbi:MAG TPA: cupin domain-containing protein [Gammaproteobacteria bacterium]|nr:cupin domain-containing protein [Gammaproteobacteria bacterium]
MSGNGDDTPAVTLRDILRAGGVGSTASEHDWAVLVRCVAASDPRALDALYQRVCAPVFTLILRTVKDRVTAEELTLDVFRYVWLRASSYDAQNGSVIAWIMNAARSRASERAWLERSERHADPRAEDERPAAHGKAREAGDDAQRERVLRTALSVLTADERLTIETAFLSGIAYAETAAVDEPHGAVKLRIRSALGKLKLILQKSARRVATPKARCERAEALPEYVLRAMPASEAASLERHLAGCTQCRCELEELQHVVDALASWGTDVLRPPRSVRRRLARRSAAETGDERILASAVAQPDPPWNQIAPGIQVKMLSADSQADRVSMLVRLAPGFAYPSHRHAGVEELHLLDGELWIDGRQLGPGDYSRAEPGSDDHIVWSGTGCTCLLITSVEDALH